MQVTKYQTFKFQFQSHVPLEKSENLLKSKIFQRGENHKLKLKPDVPYFFQPHLSRKNFHPFHPPKDKIGPYGAVHFECSSLGGKVFLGCARSCGQRRL